MDLDMPKEEEMAECKRKEAAKAQAKGPIKISFDYIRVTSGQRVAGYWELAKMSELLATSEADLMAQAPQELLKNDPAVAAQLWATLLALSLLRLKFAANHLSWKLIESKALSWLAMHQIQPEQSALADPVILKAFLP
jgi:hypothetical protein